MGSPASAADARRDSRGDRAQRVLVHHRSQGVLSPAGHRHARRLYRSAPGHLLCRDEGAPAGGRCDRPGGPGCGARQLLHRGAGHGEHRQSLHSAQAQASAKSERRPDHRPPAAQARAGPGNQRLPPGGAGRADGGRLARTQYQYALQDANLDELLQWAPRLLQKLQTLPELKDVASDQQVAGLQVSLKIDRDTAARLGIAPQAIDDTLYDAFGQRQVSTIFTQLNQYHVILEVKPQFQQDPEALRHIYVRASSGEQVPLSAFTSYEPTLTSLSVSHQGQFPATTLSFNLAPGVALGEAVTAINRAQQEIGLPPGVQASFQGTAQAFQSSLASEPFLILAALITVYIVLGVLYESYIHPI